MANPPYSAELINNAWKNSYRAARGIAYRTHNTSGFIERFILGQTDNPNYRLTQAANDLRREGMIKKGKQVNLMVRVAPNFAAGSFDPHDACDSTAATAQWVTKGFYIDKVVTHEIKLDMEQYKCINEDAAQIVSEELAFAYSRLTEKFSIAVEKQLYNEKLGKLPSYVGGVGQIPRDFGIAPVYMANGRELNEAAIGIFDADMRAAGVSSGNWWATTATRGMKYAKQIGATFINERGTDWQMFNSIVEAQYVNSAILASELKPANVAGAPANGSPMLVIENGAFFIVSAPYYQVADFAAAPQMSMEPGVRRYSIAHPTLPGVFIDIVESVETQCAEFHNLPAVRIQMSINYTLLSRTDCDYENAPFSKGKTGAYLYYLTCEDTGACDTPDYEYAAPVVVYPFEKPCNVDVTCAADLACRVSVSAPAFLQQGNNTFALFTALVTPSAGASNPASYAWLLNGAPYATTDSPNLLVNITDLSDGDVISLVYEDSLDCAQTVAFTPIDFEAQGICGTLIVSYLSNEVQPDDVINLGNLPQTGAGVTTPIVLNLGAAGFAIVPTASVIGSATGVVVSPATIVVGAATGTATVSLKTEDLGPGVVDLSIVTCAGNFKIGLSFTVIP
jgi:hypothetical protein